MFSIRAMMTAVLLLISGASYAHPVSFKDSIGLMSYQSPEFNHHQVNYSLEYWWAVGIHNFNRTQFEDQRATFASSNFLIHRVNGDAFQANLYGLLGAGRSSFAKVGQNEDEKTAGLAALQFDIEDRHYYFLAKHSEARNDDAREFSQSVIRAGLAPYQGEFYDLHTWIIMEYSKSRFGSHTEIEEWTPLLRFFYRNVLFEIGQTLDGDSKFNFITHF